MRWVVERISRRNPEVVYFARTDRPVVALTLDDGPDPETTPEILDVLGKNGARATFFLITSRVPGNERLVDRIAAEGHEIGNHLKRDEPSAALSPAEFEEQLVDAHETLARFGEVRWFRPGSGFFNAPMLATLGRHGYRCALGSVYPLDPLIPFSWFARAFIGWATQPGSVIILHDGGGRGRRTASTLARVLPSLRERGYRVVALSELVALESPELATANASSR